MKLDIGNLYFLILIPILIFFIYYKKNYNQKYNTND